jgi:hypothetical protein
MSITEKQFLENQIEWNEYDEQMEDLIALYPVKQPKSISDCEKQYHDYYYGLEDTTYDDWFEEQIDKDD